MGFEVAPGADNIPWIKAILAEQKWRGVLTDVEMAALGTGYWTPEEWQELEATGEYEKQQQQQQQQRLDPYQQHQHQHQQEQCSDSYYSPDYYPQQYQQHKYHQRYNSDHYYYPQRSLPAGAAAKTCHSAGPGRR